jgi:hypothetical protein
MNAIITGDFFHEAKEFPTQWPWKLGGDYIDSCRHLSFLNHMLEAGPHPKFNTQVLFSNCSTTDWRIVLEFKFVSVFINLSWPQCLMVSLSSLLSLWIPLSYLWSCVP